MSDKSQDNSTLIKLDPIQFKDLITAIAYIVDGQKNIFDKLTTIEGELKLLRIEIADKKGKFN